MTATLPRLALGALAAAALAACSSVTDTLLEVTDPDIVDPVAASSPDGAVGLRNGALARFRTATTSTESSWLFGGLLADEWSTSSTFVQNDETDQRAILENNSSVTTQFRNLNRARTAANLAIKGLREFRPNPASDLAEMYFVRGFAEMQLAQDFCNGIPLTDASEPEIRFAAPQPVEAVSRVAVASFDTAIALANGTDAASVNVNRAARIARARALLGINQPAEAATTVAGIPTTYSYDHTYSLVTGDNILWSQPASQMRYTVGDSVEGNARNLRVQNAIPFHSARDPRVPSSYTVGARNDTSRAQDGLTYIRRTSLWQRTTPVAVANGIDARLVEAEARLRAGDAPGMLAILNALRAAPPRLGEVQPATMPALVDPGTPERRVDLLFREKAFWTFGRGQRLGDLRRLIRQYGRTQEQVFPTGVHYKGGVYGTDVNLPVPNDERNNPQVGPDKPACIDRRA